MAIKCKNCGNYCSNTDLFCPKCGYNIASQSNETVELKAKTDNKKEISKSNIINNDKKENKESLEADINTEEKNAKEEKIDERLKPEFYEQLKAKYSDNDFTFKSGKKFKMGSTAFNLGFYFIIVLCVLMSVTFFIINRHTTQKIYLNYKNCIENPALIPELKEPKNINELISNLSSVQQFLYLYLRFSADTIEKKEQVFASYLKEMNKFPHITNEILISNPKDKCAQISNSLDAKKCAQRITNDLKDVGINAFPVNNTVYLYPDAKFTKERYSRFLSPEFKQYLSLSAKYNLPTGIGLELYISPKTLVNKITDFENLYNKTNDANIKEWIENIIYCDFRRLIFTPSIYDTTTQEMTKEFKNAYRYFITKKRGSALMPTVMSYMDKKRSYGEENFRNDYPFKIFDNSFSETVENSMFSDVFAQLRRSIVAQNEPKSFAFVYNFSNATWEQYVSHDNIKANNYILSDIDDNKITIYNNLFAEIQELSVQPNSRLFLFNDNLLIYNAGHLSVAKMFFNGRNFSVQELSSFEISSIFPGVEIIPVDTLQDRTIYLEKDNRKAAYMLLARHGSGYENYKIMAEEHSVSILTLPNMFSVDSDNEVPVVFAKVDSTGDVGNDYYTFKIRTRGHQNEEIQMPIQQQETYAQYDDKTALDEQQNPEKHEANIMPKIDNNPQQNENNAIQMPPEQQIEPPKDAE